MKIEQEIKRIENFIVRLVKKSRAKGIITGLSGGIDSTTTLTICSRAIGKDKMLALILPCHSKESDLKDAILVANHLNINYIIINLTEIYDSFVKTIGNLKFIKQINMERKIANANLKARLRMCTLYYFANMLNYLVAGTGNKSEDDIGYFTKYGDSGVDFLPIQHLYKHEVRELARFLKIPEKIINRKPSAGLWEGQTDEDELSNQLGFNLTYDLLDEMLENIHANNYNKKDEKYKKLIELMEINKHKIELPPNLKRA